MSLIKSDLVRGTLEGLVDLIKKDRESLRQCARNMEWGQLTEGVLQDIENVEHAIVRQMDAEREEIQDDLVILEKLLSDLPGQTIP